VLQVTVKGFSQIVPLHKYFNMKFTFSALVFLLGMQLVSCQEKPSNGTPGEEVQQKASSYAVVDAEEFKQLLDKGEAILVDVRTPGEVAQGIIPGAIHIDYMDWDAFEEGVSKLDKEVPVMVYCKVGGRSGKASQYMKQNGFSEIYDLKGGYDSWMQNNFETVKP
jgi:rhodanese-related sulfurtransferase